MSTAGEGISAKHAWKASSTVQSSKSLPLIACNTLTCKLLNNLQVLRTHDCLLEEGVAALRGRS